MDFYGDLFSRSEWVAVDMYGVVARAGDAYALCLKGLYAAVGGECAVEELQGELWRLDGGEGLKDGDVHESVAHGCGRCDKGVVAVL